MPRNDRPSLSVYKGVGSIYRKISGLNVSVGNGEGEQVLKCATHRVLVEPKYISPLFECGERDLRDVLSNEAKYSLTTFDQ